MKAALLISSVIVGLSAIALAGNLSNENNQKVVKPGKFYGLIVNSGSNVILSQGEENTFRIEGDKSEVEKISADVENGALVIREADVNHSTVYVTVKDINLIDVSGNGRVFVVGSINSDIIILKVNDHGSICADVQAMKVGLLARGSGKIIVSGSASESFLQLSGEAVIYKKGLDILSEEAVLSPLRIENKN